MNLILTSTPTVLYPTVLPRELDVKITASLSTNTSTPQPSTLPSHTPYNHIHAPRSPLLPSRNRTISHLSKTLYILHH